MSSQNGLVAATSQTGLEEQPLPPLRPLPPLPEPNYMRGTRHLQRDSTHGQNGVSTRLPRLPRKWPIVGLAHEIPKEQRAQDIAQSSLQLTDNSIPPQLLARQRLTYEKPPALPPRNTASSNYNTAKAVSGSYMNSRKGGLSVSPMKSKSEQSKFICPDHAAHAQPKWVTATETLSLLQFVEKCSDSLPAQVSVEKGYYGSNDQETVGNEETLIISYLKSRKSLTIITSTWQKYSLPLGSAVRLGLLYNPSGNKEKARKGYTFQTVGDLVRQSPHLPKVVCVTKAYKGDSLTSTVYANELLLVINFNTQTEKLHVISLAQNSIRKFLPIQCSGCFTTKPSEVRMHVSDIYKYISTPVNNFELQAELELSELKRMSVSNSIDQSLQGVVKISGFATERSLIATRIAEKCSSLSAAETKFFEIPANDNLSDVQVTVIQKNMAETHLPHPSSLKDELELWNQQENTESTKTQRLFDDFLRHGYEREGVAYNTECNIYDDPHNPATTSQGDIVPAYPYAVHDLFQPDNKDCNKYDEAHDLITPSTSIGDISLYSISEPYRIQDLYDKQEEADMSKSGASEQVAELTQMLKELLQDSVRQKQEKELKEEQRRQERELADESRFRGEENKAREAELVEEGRLHDEEKKAQEAELAEHRRVREEEKKARWAELAEERRLREDEKKAREAELAKERRLLEAENKAQETEEHRFREAEKKAQEAELQKEWCKRYEELAKREEETRKQLELLQSLVEGVRKQGDVAQCKIENEKDVGTMKMTDNDDIEAYLTNFERLMISYEVRKDQWAFRLAPQLVGKAQQVYAGMTVSK